MKPGFSIAFIVVLGMAGAAAPGIARSAVAAQLPDPCSLLTPAQVGAVLQAKVDASNRIVSTLCEWDTTPPSAKRVTLTVEDAQRFDSAKAPLPSTQIVKTPITGLGDDAVSIVVSNAAASLVVKKGAVSFVVRLYGVPVEQVKEKEQALALEILKKL